MKYIIYKITIGEYVYIGSTKNYTRRKCEHKRKCNKNENILVYNKINELGGWDNVIMIPIEELECDSRIQAVIREEHFRNEYEAKLNTRRCYQPEDKKEYDKIYYAENKDMISEKNKIYRDKNKDIISEKAKLNYAENKDIISEKAKLYYAENKDIINEKAKLYYAENKDIISEKNCKITCECGSSFNNKELNCHLKTKKHCKFNDDKPK